MITRKTDPVLYGEAIALLRKHLKYSITVPQLARQLLISERTLQRIFQQVCNEGVYAHFKKMKTEHAQNLLLNGYSIKQAALACGYKTESAFVQAFKGITSYTPKEWLKRQAA